MNRIIKFSELQKSGIGLEFEGHKFDNIGTTFIIVNAAPGDGVKLHCHPYTEIFIVQEGTGLFTIGGKEMIITGGQIIIVPPEVPHKFINTGKSNLQQIDIHQSPKFITKWLED